MNIPISRWPVPEIKDLPEDLRARGEAVALLDSKDNPNRALADRVCADQITPYPPGIPVLVPGQIVTREALDYLGGLLRSQKRMELHGIVHDGYIPCLRVLKASEERGLKRLA